MCKTYLLFFELSVILHIELKTQNEDHVLIMSIENNIRLYFGIFLKVSAEIKKAQKNIK